MRYSELEFAKPELLQLYYLTVKKHCLKTGVKKRGCLKSLKPFKHLLLFIITNFVCYLKSFTEGSPYADCADETALIIALCTTRAASVPTASQLAGTFPTDRAYKLSPSALV